LKKGCSKVKVSSSLTVGLQGFSREGAKKVKVGRKGTLKKKLVVLGGRNLPRWGGESPT